MMPGMTGWRLTEELARTREPIPVIYMSGYPDPAHHLDDADNAAVLQKPFTPRTLLNAVHVALDDPASARRPPSDTESHET
jgi:CheY-like chemotaxis protein